MTTAAPSIAIVGAGLCGLRLAQRLLPVARVTVFEKSRGLGGRMSTRRADPFQFDHGAQYVTAKGDAFRVFLAPYLADGTMREWAPRMATLGGDAPCRWTAPRYVAVPGMSSLAKAMAEGYDVRREAEVAGLDRRVDGWTVCLKDGAQAGGFDWVLLATPSVQAGRLVPDDFAARDVLDAARMRGAFSLMLGFDGDLDLPWDAAACVDSPLGWIAADRTKPGRPEATSILCQSTPDWAEANLERDADAVRADLSAAFADLTGVDAGTAAYTRLHRWRFSAVGQPAADPCLMDADAQLGAAGDWCGTARPGRVEAAFDSAEALADAVLARIG